MTDPLHHFYKKSYPEKLSALLDANLITLDHYHHLHNTYLNLPIDLGTHMIENYVGNYSLPMGLGRHFLIEGESYTVPMAIEEPSVIAAASFGAKIIQKNGGFYVTPTDRLMIGQIAITDIPDIDQAVSQLTLKKEQLIQQAHQSYPSIVKRGGGITAIDIRVITPDASQNTSPMIVLHLYVDTCEAMGANMINTMLEALTPSVTTLTGGHVLMSILSNYATHSLVTVTCSISPNDLKTRHHSGEGVRDRIVQATQWAHIDPYRAVTHNKGIMNGIDAVVIATGNDWRATSAGIHAYAARTGTYQSLTDWTIDEASGHLSGRITIPLALATVGGSIGFHPAAQLAHHLLQHPTAKQLAHIVASVGLAQNLAALRALVTEGIQKGHMSLQARSLAINAGATGDHIDIIAKQLIQHSPMNLDTARRLLADLNT